MTGQGTVQNVVEAIKLGAKDFITKPFDKDVLLNKIDALRKTRELEDRVDNLKELLSDKYGFDSIVSSSRAMRLVFEKASAAAGSNAPVFIVGETGTGKELMAKAIHLKSQRAARPFIAVNCGAIPKEYLNPSSSGIGKGPLRGR